MAQGVAIRAAEERHTAVLEHLSQVAEGMLGQLEPEEARLRAGAAAGGPARDKLTHMLEGALAAAKRRLPPEAAA